MAKGYKHMTPDQEQQVLAEYRDSQIVTVTASRVGVSPDQVRAALKRHNIQPSKAQERGKCWENQDKIREMAAAGKTRTAIAEAVGCNRRHLKAFLERHGIETVEYTRQLDQNPAWRGGKIVDKDSYILVKAPGHPNRDRHGYVRDHRLVMEAVLGRLLEADEVVHHRDENKQNNDPSNLEIFVGNGYHLAQTRKGVPNPISEEGRERIRESRRQYWQKKRESTPAE